MKMRIKGDSLRLRLSRSEVERLLGGQRIAETIHFGVGEGERLTYFLEKANQSAPASVRYEPQHIAVSLSNAQVVHWGQDSEVGVYSSIPLSPSMSLEVIIEKDFACLDRSEKRTKIHSKILTLARSAKTPGYGREANHQRAILRETAISGEVTASRLRRSSVTELCFN